ncbi:MAG: hypothetical protein EU533_01135 [Promethearchaeota archaeon]|nr:MAG: hypothetical protein EU533_01135 [Candidatus Lokiarchaeota archaeon]
MPNFLIITSTEDKASMNIREQFLKSKQYTFNESSLKWHENKVYQMEPLKGAQCSTVYLGLTNEKLIFLDDLKLNDLKTDFIIFASRHASKASRPSLLVHTTGNWNDSADFGGSPNDLSEASALLFKAGFISLIESANFARLIDFPVDVEVTHHGPTILDKPLIFLELGSSKKEWGNIPAGKVVADAIINTVIKYEYLLSPNIKIGLGFGGTHYAPNFNRMLLNNEVAISFICPKYFIRELDDSMIKLMIENTFEKVDCFIIDWKGINSEGKSHLIPILEEYDIPILKTKDFN